MVKPTYLSIILGTLLVLGSITLVTPASAEPEIYRRGDRPIPIDHSKREGNRPDSRPLRLPNGNVIRAEEPRWDLNDRPDWRRVSLPNGHTIRDFNPVRQHDHKLGQRSVRLPSGDIVRLVND